jgi:hypothetical protein
MFWNMGMKKATVRGIERDFTLALQDIILDLAIKIIP